MIRNLLHPALRDLGAERAAESPDADELTAVRAWARSRGYPIDESAGVPAVVLRTYRRLHAG